MKDRVVLPLLALFLSVACASLPASHHQRTAQEVVDAHLAGLNACNFDALMAIYPSEVHLFLRGGQVVNGRDAVAAIYRQTVKPFKDGGVCGLKFEADATFTVDGTVNVQWRATSAELLIEPYLGADAHVTKNGMMWAPGHNLRPCGDQRATVVTAADVVG
jgi:hypothetical protein